MSFLLPSLSLGSLHSRPSPPPPSLAGLQEERALSSANGLMASFARTPTATTTGCLEGGRERGREGGREERTEEYHKSDGGPPCT